MSWIDVKTHKAQPLSWWYNEFLRGRINMQPGYQRRSNLWGRWKKAHLIDSIINGFDIPKFYVADFNRSGSDPLNEEEQPYAVIDGKQRFESLFLFLSGEISLNPSSEYSIDPTVKLANLNYHQLREKYPRIADRLEEYEPVVMSVTTDSKGMIEQLFVRLNSGVSINGAERRNAMPGPVPPIVRDITVHPFFGERVRFSKDRMQEFNLAAKLLLFEVSKSLAETKARNLDAFVIEAHKQTEELVRILDKEETAQRLELVGEDRLTKKKYRELVGQLEELERPYKAAEEAVMQNLDLMTAMFANRDPLLTKQGAIPVYYWFVRNNRTAVTRDFFRAFLIEFDPQVLQAVRTARTAPDDADSELLSYYNASRTSNDKASMEMRYVILSKRFAAWLKKNR